MSVSLHGEPVVLRWRVSRRVSVPLDAATLALVFWILFSAIGLRLLDLPAHCRPIIRGTPREYCSLLRCVSV